MSPRGATVVVPKATTKIHSVLMAIKRPYPPIPQKSVSVDR